jgi:hypothetical protein
LPGGTYLVKRIFGHRSFKVTQPYARLSPAYKRAMVLMLFAITLRRCVPLLRVLPDQLALHVPDEWQARDLVQILHRKRGDAKPIPLSTDFVSVRLASGVSRLSQWKSAWAAACKEAKIRYRWHDLRHTFISRLAENPVVSEGTIKSLAGHVSKRMLERYSHIRTHAKRAAIEALEQVQVPIPACSGTNPSEAQAGAILGESGHKIGHTQ